MSIFLDYSLKINQINQITARNKSFICCSIIFGILLFVVNALVPTFYILFIAKREEGMLAVMVGVFLTFVLSALGCSILHYCVWSQTKGKINQILKRANYRIREGDYMWVAGLSHAWIQLNLGNDADLPSAPVNPMFNAPNKEFRQHQEFMQNQDFRQNQF